MGIQEWSALIVGVITAVSAVGAGVRWLVKHYLAELKPNGGGSLNDRLSRVEQQVDRIYEILIGGNR